MRPTTYIISTIDGHTRVLVTLPSADLIRMCQLVIAMRAQSGVRYHVQVTR